MTEHSVAETGACPVAAPAATTVDCPVCGSPACTPVHAAVDRWMAVPGRFRYVRCAACGAWYLRERPAPEEMARYYPPTYIVRGRGPAAIRDWFRRRDLAPRVALVARQPGRRLLDVGCGNGAFLEAMRTRGWVVAGVEPIAWAVDEVRRRGIPVWPRQVCDAPLPEAAFDVVTMWDVVEHLERPAADLRRVARSLRPGARLIVNTPVADGWEARAFGRAWAGWDAPRHLVLFDRAGLDGLLSAAGFRVIERAWVSESYLITAMSLALAARARLPRKIADALWWLAHSRPVRLLAAPVFARLDRAWGGCWVTIVAERVTPPPVAARAWMAG